MKNAILIGVVVLGTAMIVWETSHRRVKRSKGEKSAEISRWESEGGAVPAPGPDAPASAMNALGR
jgi:hypothetical protein